jgi:hypothetical protein
MQKALLNNTFILLLMLKSATEISSILNLSNVYQSSGRSLLAIELLEKTIQTERLSNIQKVLNNLGNNYV